MGATKDTYLYYPSFIAPDHFRGLLYTRTHLGFQFKFEINKICGVTYFEHLLMPHYISVMGLTEKCSYQYLTDYRFNHLRNALLLCTHLGISLVGTSGVEPKPRKPKFIAK